jgi:hypothetical protein
MRATRRYPPNSFCRTFNRTSHPDAASDGQAVCRYAVKLSGDPQLDVGVGHRAREVVSLGEPISGTVPVGSLSDIAARRIAGDVCGTESGDSPGRIRVWPLPWKNCTGSRWSGTA